MPDVTCEICAGVVSRVGLRGPLSKVCSAECRREKRRRRAADEYRQGKRPRKPVLPRIGVCEECGSTFTAGRIDKRFCSARCANRPADRKRRAEGTKKVSSPLVRTKVCAWCDTTYTTTRWVGRYCSNHCARFGSGQAQPSSTLKWQHCKHCDLWRSHGLCPRGDTHHPRRRRTPPDMSPRPCHSCGTPFTPIRPAGYFAVYCSQRCRQRETNARRRAHQGTDRRHRTDRLSGKVRRHAIYARDRWVCQLCKRKVNPKLTVPHPRAATLDHVLPVSLGGTHDEANLQLAHLGCNSKKRNKVNGNGEQLRMIA